MTLLEFFHYPCCLTGPVWEIMLQNDVMNIQEQVIINLLANSPMEMLNNRMFPFNFIYSIWMKLRHFASYLGLILFNICKEIISHLLHNIRKVLFIFICSRELFVLFHFEVLFCFVLSALTALQLAESITNNILIM